MCDVYSQLCCFGAMSVDLVNNIVVGAQSFLSSLYKSCFVQRLRHPICHPNSNRTRWEEWHKKKAHDIVIIQLIKSNSNSKWKMAWDMRPVYWQDLLVYRQQSVKKTVNCLDFGGKPTGIFCLINVLVTDMVL